MRKPSQGLRSFKKGQPCWGQTGTVEEESQANKPQAEVKGNMSQFTALSQADGRWRHTHVSVMLFPYARRQDENVKDDKVGDLKLYRNCD